MKSALFKFTEGALLGDIPIGMLIDVLYDLREERKALSRQDSKLKEKEDAIEIFLLNEMSQTNEETKGGKKCTVSIKRAEVPDVYDWDKFYAYMNKTKANRLLQRRPTVESFRELWAEGVKVPGVKKMFRITLSVTMKRGKV